MAVQLVDGHLLYSIRCNQGYATLIIPKKRADDEKWHKVSGQSLKLLLLLSFVYAMFPDLYPGEPSPNYYYYYYYDSKF